MVDEQLRARDIRSSRVLDAMLNVPRHLFVPAAQRAGAYVDSPLPIGHGQTISQPYIVAFMTEALDVQPDHRVLEIGTGSGYQAAVLGTLAKEVYTIEIIAALAEQARKVLSDLGSANVQVRTGNGYLRLARACALRSHHGDRGAGRSSTGAGRATEGRRADGDSSRRTAQELRILRRTATGMETITTLPVRFVPMTGKPKPESPFQQ